MIPTEFTITRSDGSWERVDHPDPDVRSAVIAWHMGQAARRNLTITITIPEGLPT